uniref:Ig-like domain-containing protein n=1 Tax=Erpetoichthys calabaricus TaxID=27687 RepID=A0A8C4SI03_ERPCA
MLLSITRKTPSGKTLTQPTVVSMSLGETAIIDCNVQIDQHSVKWLKQVPGCHPPYILGFHHSHSAPANYGTGFSSRRFTSKANNKIEYQLIISNVEASDSAVYYCHTWDSSASFEVSQ